jgi:leader peptidase (prepilin peptidase)/N-methyltransferase
MLRGRCRDCSEPISPRYPIVEAVTSVLFALVPAVIGVLWVVPAYWAFVGVAIVLTLTDLDLKKIPNKILYPGTVLAGSLLIVGSLLDGEPGRLLPAAGSAIGYFGALFVLALLARGGFGFGDVKLAFLLGLFVGYISWQYVMVAAFAAFGAAGLYAIVVLALRRRGRKSEIPFGPYLIVGSYLAIAFGDPAITWWLR